VSAHIFGQLSRSHLFIDISVCIWYTLQFKIGSEVSRASQTKRIGRTEASTGAPLTYSVGSVKENNTEYTKLRHTSHDTEWHIQ
jgi:hypothetical protein